MPGRTVNDAGGSCTVVVTAVVGASVAEVADAVPTGVDASVAGVVRAADDGLEALSLEHEAAASPSTTDAARTIRGERMRRV
jgi:hypothetical protein